MFRLRLYISDLCTNVRNHLEMKKEMKNLNEERVVIFSN